MAVRSESVRLSLDDQFTSKMARATAATSVFKKELNSLDGKRVSRELDDTAKSVDRIGSSSRSAGPEIDKFSGRLGLVLDSALALGPALIPLSAAAIPALTGALAGLGAAAGGLSVTILALAGIGDGLKAIDAYQLDKTPENLQKMRVELEKLGPAGAEFARFLDDLEPQLKALQNVAREGMFPGVEDGIDSLLTRLPLVRGVVKDLSQEMGNLAADAGDSLSGDKWTPFLEMVRRDAAPTLDDFARATGNVALGLANILVAFEPLSRGFSGGLEEMTQRFAEWSQGLDTNTGFQDFLGYVQKTGPEAIALIGGLVEALSGIVHAAAPIGSAALPVLTALAKVIGAIGNSQIGPALYGGILALRLYSRAADMAERSQFRLNATLNRLGDGQVLARGAAGLGLLALSATNVDEKLGVANTAMDTMAGFMVGGPWGAAIGFGIGAAQDFAAANDDLEASISRANAAMDAGSLPRMRAEYQELSKQIDAITADANRGVLDQLFSGSTYSDFVKLITGSFGEARDKQAELKQQMQATKDAAGILAPAIGLTAKELYNAAGAAQDFSDSLSSLNGWLDKRDAIKGYRDGIKSLTTALHDGFQPKDVDNINAVGRNIAQVASLIKDRGLRNDFLSGARASLVDLANNSGPKAKAEVQELIKALDRYGLTKPPVKKLEVDNSDAKQKTNSSQKLLDELVGRPYTAKVTVDGGQALTEANAVQSALARIVSKTITVTVNRVGDALGKFDWDTGGYTGPGPRLEPRGIVHAGEVVLPQDVVRRDWGMLKSRYGTLPGFAEGGLVQNTYTSRHRGGDGDQGVQLFVAGAWSAAKALKALQHEADRVGKAFDAEKSKLESLTSQRDSLASSTASSLIHDPFGNGLAGFNAQVGADAADSQAMLTALQTLVHNGLDPKGALFQALAASGDVNTAQQMAVLTSEQLFAEQAQFNQRGALAGQVGSFAGDQAFGALIGDTQKAVNELRNEVKHLNQAVNRWEKAAKDLPDKAGKAVHDGAASGTKAGHDGRNQRLAAASNTQSRPLTRGGRR
jgi:hypothetical protein